jgi:hypothetical protein
MIKCSNSSSKITIISITEIIIMEMVDTSTIGMIIEEEILLQVVIIDVNLIDEVEITGAVIEMILILAMIRKGLDSRNEII